MTERQAGRLRNVMLRRTHVCAQCHSLLVEIWDESVECRLRVVCSKDHDHEGRVSKAAVGRREQQSRTEGLELRKIFPELSGYREPTRAEIDKDFTDLFG